MSQTCVPAIIRPNSKWLIVGEAPGEQEEKQGEPFVGPTGELVNNFISAIGYRRDQFDITNVIHYRPPNNDLSLAKQEHIQAGKAELLALLEAKHYDAILALGWFALLALTGFDGIYEHRGSVYPLRLGGKPLSRPSWIVPTLHPALLFHEPKLANVIFRDFFKFQRVTQGWKPPAEPVPLLYPTVAQAEEWLARAKREPWLVVDIETPPKTKRLAEIGFATSELNAMTIQMPKDREHPLWDIARRAVEDDQPKVFHNAMFDVPWLDYCLGWHTGGELHDTMLAHHALYPELPADLGFCVSIYTDYAYHKHLGQSASVDDRQLYNALDCARTAAIFPVIEKKLRSVSLYEVYEQDRKMLQVARKMSLRGMRYDEEESTRLEAKCKRTQARWQMLLDKRAGEQINVFSHPQVCKLLYEDLKLPKQYKKDRKSNKNKLTTGQLKLLTLYPKLTDKRQRAVLRAVLNVRWMRKFRSSYLKCKRGSDGRMRTSFGVGRAETGRWTASTFLIDLEGTNLQTIPPIWKSCFIADDGMVLVVADYSQIEARLVAYDAEDQKQIEVFERGGDIHIENAARILEKPIEKVTDIERQVYGKTVHALNYDVGTGTLCESVNKKGLETGLWVTEEQADYARRKYQGLYKEAQRWKNRQWQAVKSTKILTNHLGRRRIFLGPTRGQFAYVTRGESIAFVPQSDVPDMLNVALGRLDAAGIDLLLQVHDAVVLQIPEGEVEAWVPKIKELMAVPLQIHGRTCLVPTDVKIGKRMSKLVKLEKWRLTHGSNTPSASIARMDSLSLPSATTVASS